MDPTANLSSLFFLMIGKDSQWFPLIIILMTMFQKWDTMYRGIRSFCKLNYTRYTLSSTIYVNSRDAYIYGKVSPSVRSILFALQPLLTSTYAKSKVRTITIPSCAVIKDQIMIPDKECSVNLHPDIHVTVETQSTAPSRSSYTTDDGGNSSMDIQTIQITLCLESRKPFSEISAFIESLTKQYNTAIEEKNSTHLILRPIYSRTRECSVFDDIQTIDFTSNKTFDTLFFDGKEELIRRLNTFKNREQYSSLGVPQTFGILLHGEPGTGKTSVIKAIANYTKMHLILVPTSKVKTRRQLEELFYGYSIALYPPEKRIYVFEEIDCNGWGHIVYDREKRKEFLESDGASVQSDESKDSDLGKLVTLMETKKRPQKQEDDDKLTLGALLEVLDGLIECPGRIVIMTTNHRDRLDPALVRPGRIDVEIEFKRLRKPHIASLFKQWYNQEIPLQKLNKVKDLCFTQAELSQLFFQHEGQPTKCIQSLMYKSKGGNEN